MVCSSKALACLLLLLLVSTTKSISFKTIYITPENDMQRCKQYKECFTLSELHYQNFTSDIILRLNFLSGEHSLNWNMTFDGGNVTLRANTRNRALIKCQNTSAGISFSNARFASIENLEFSGCTSKVLISANWIQYLKISGAHFANNSCGWYVLLINNTCNAEITNSNFIRNTVPNDSSIIYGKINQQACSTVDSIKISNSTKLEMNIINNLFIQNNGTIIYCEDWNIFLKNNTFSGNAIRDGGGILSKLNVFTSTQNTFSYNTEDSSTYAIITMLKTGFVNISNDTFHNNIGLVIKLVTRQSKAVIHNTIITNNTMSLSIFDTSVSFTGDITCSENNEAIALFKSQINFYGNGTFANNLGGAIKSTQSKITFKSESVVQFVNNTNDLGGAISLDGGSLVSYGKISFTENRASKKGGALYAFRSNIVLENNNETFRTPNTMFTGNTAEQGGAVYFIAAGITITSHWLIISDSSAKEGGGIFLNLGSYIHLDKDRAQYTRSPKNDTKLEIMNYSAQKGGALYSTDDLGCAVSKNPENADTASQCFLQVRALYTHDPNDVNIQYINIFFFNNTAKQSGGDIYGGLLDRCTPSMYTELFIKMYHNMTGLYMIENIIEFDWAKENLANSSGVLSRHLSSKAVQLCFCINGKIDCSYRNRTISVKKGHIFFIMVIIVDQVGTPMKATVVSRFESSSGNQSFKGKQTNQEIPNQCSVLSYNVYSDRKNTTGVQFYPQGPCEYKGISKKNLTLVFEACECPIGFTAMQSNTDCECTCDERLKEYVSECNSTTNRIVIGGQFWIKYINTTANNTGYVISDCPFDYCLNKNGWPEEGTLDNSDNQCDYNRTGILCGGCAKGLSHMLGSSKCAKCSNVYLLLIIPFALAGIAVVIFVLYVNLTVATGTINGAILYANIMRAESSRFVLDLTRSADRYMPTIVTWLNLDLGIPTCFYDGMSSYGKVLLQLVFPLYLFTLTGIIIVLCKYSRRMSALLAQRNPVAALCTFILLSYSKLTRTLINMVQGTTLHYPDGSSEHVWSYDGNVNYFTLAHIPKILLAGVIIIIGVGYTALLFFAQWIQQYSHKKPFKWANNTKYQAFIDAMHAPFLPKRRYWFGLLLFIITTHDVIPVFIRKYSTRLSMGLIAFGLILLKLINKSTYKSYLCDVLETFFLTNLAIFSFVTLYLQNEATNTVHLVSFFSICITYAIFLVIVGYHTAVYVWKVNKSRLFLRLKVWIRRRSNYQPVLQEEDDSGTTTEPNPVGKLEQMSPLARPLIREPIRQEQKDLDQLAPICPEDYEVTPHAKKHTQPPPSNKKVSVTVVELTPPF